MTWPAMLIHMMMHTEHFLVVIRHPTLMESSSDYFLILCLINKAHIIYRNK